MTITFFGIICFIILVVLLFVPIKYTIATLMISTVFQSSAVINLQDKGITATLVIEAYLFIRYLLINKRLKKDDKLKEKYNEKLINRFIIFLILSIILSFLSSMVFKDMYIYNKYKSNPINFEMNLSVIIRIIILFFNISSLYIIYKLKNLYDNDFIKRVVIISIIVVLIFGFWEFLWKITNKAIYFPYELIYNNVGYAQGYDQGYIEGRANLTNVRMNSTFLEPSYCGCFLVASLYSIISINENKKYNKLVFFIALAIVLNLSGTGMLLLGIVGIYYFWYTNKGKISTKTFLKIFLLGILAIVFLLSSGYLERILDMLFNKMESISGIQRSYYDKMAIQIFKNTYFIGGGLNCYRASSFFYNLLGTVGIIGTSLFLYNVVMYLRTIKFKISNNNDLAFGFFYLVAVLIGMFISIPDITFLQMWFAFMYLIAMDTTKEREEKN